MLLVGYQEGHLACETSAPVIANDSVLRKWREENWEHQG